MPGAAAQDQQPERDQPTLNAGQPGTGGDLANPLIAVPEQHADLSGEAGLWLRAPPVLSGVEYTIDPCRQQ
ncbi:MAG: hypothetical protein ACRDXB_13545, partial [Actinomycetes bacterium]